MKQNIRIDSHSLNCYDNSQFRSILLGSLLIIGLYSGIFFIPLYLQEIQRMSPLEVGLLLLLPSLTSGVATLFAGHVYPRIGAFRLVIAGAVLSCWHLGNSAF